jgi:hypothetical protein
LNVDPYRGEWVALDPTTYAVLGHDRALEEAELQALAHGINHPLLLPVPLTDHGSVVSIPSHNGTAT